MNKPKLESIAFRPSLAKFLYGSVPGWLFIGLTCSVVLTPYMLVLLLYLYIRCRYSENTLTDDRLLIKRGFLFRSEEEVELYRIKDVRATYGIIQERFNHGTLIITTSSDSYASDLFKKGRLTIPNVPNAKAIRDEIRHRKEIIRDRKRVREVDVYGGEGGYEL